MTNKNPVALTPDTVVMRALSAHIPNARWGCWKYEDANGRLAKVPFGTSGRLSTARADGWLSYAEAEKSFEAGGFDGLALLITGSDLVAVDIDRCLGEGGALLPDTPEEIRNAVDTLKDGGAYIECSPSGKGLRALLRGAKPPGCSEKNSTLQAELYDGGTKGRYVTVTGRIWDSSPVCIIDGGNTVGCVASLFGLKVAESGSEAKATGEERRNLSPLSDDAIAAKVRQGGGRGLGARLWAGSLGDYEGDHSAADLALAVLIAKWTDDSAQVGRVFGMSALAAREKWTDRADYRERTIATALKTARADLASKEITLKAAAEKVTSSLATGNEHLAGWLASCGGKVPRTVAAIERILSLDSRCTALFAFDEFAGCSVKLRSLHSALGDAVPKDREPETGHWWSDSDTRALSVWLDHAWGVSMATREVDEAIEIAARRVAFNSVADALSRLKWDGKKRLDTWLIDYLDADTTHDPEPLICAWGRAWMISAVARVLQPGCKVDTVLVCQGPQGAGKSRAIRALVDGIAPRAFREGLPALGRDDKEASQYLLGAWVIELSELAFASRAESETIKAFLSKQADTVRMPYGRRFAEHPRTAVFFGTSNESAFITDVSGARRFMSFITRGCIKVEALREAAAQLWAEAVAAYRAGEVWHLVDPDLQKLAEESQRRRIAGDQIDEVVMERLVEAVLMTGTRAEAAAFRQSSLMVWRLLGFEERDFSRSTLKLNASLRRVGFEPTKGDGRTWWQCSERLLQQVENGRCAM
ncbi:MAG: VapE domain-containing protein [Pseudomonadota bacterium]